MKKRKGFTLAELLAVIVILGIITSITVPIVTDQIDKYKTKVCVTQYDNILNAARSYGADHLTELGKSKTITLKTLNDGGYIDASNLKDPVTKEKISLELQIHIVKIGKKYKYYLDDSENIGCRDELQQKFYDEKNLFAGIPSKEYTQGAKVSYLGYNWIVMRDNGTNTQLVMDGYLSSNELKVNLPTDVDSSSVSSSGGIQMCVEKSKTYCGWYNDGTNIEYSWNKSIVKPTIEKWIKSKMEEKGLEKEKELKGMAFTDDGVDTINSYVRIPVYDEVKTLEKSCDEKGPYCADNNDYMFSDYDYWVLTKYSSDGAYFFVSLNDSSGGLWNHWVGMSSSVIRPVITVNEN